MDTISDHIGCNYFFPEAVHIVGHDEISKRIVLVDYIVPGHGRMFAVKKS